MTEDKQPSFNFKMISGKKVTADFSGGDVSSDAGVLLMKEEAERIGIIDKIVEAMSDPRNQSYVVHDLKTLLTQRIIQIVCGYEDANDADYLRTDPGFKAACDRLPSDGDLASQPTISRFENSLTKRDIYRIAKVLVKLFIASYKTRPEGIILDIDDTDDPTHGAQQLSLFNGYYDEYCFEPLFIFEGQSGQLITSILRPGKRPSGKETCAIIKRVVTLIRSAWPTVGIIIRGDSHFATPELFAWCDSHNVDFIVGLTSNNVLMSHTDNALEAARRDYKTSGTNTRTFREINYQAGTWHRELRVIIMAEVSAKGDNIRFIVTSLESSQPSFMYETVYCGRGQMENFIKDHKIALKSGRTSCHSFLANCFRLMLHSAAYVIFHSFRERGLAGTEFAKAQFDTIRLRLLKIGVEVKELKTKLHFILPSSYPLKNVFATIYNKIVLQM
jgi:hypothetical protein